MPDDRRRNQKGFQDIRSRSGRLLCRVDAERDILEFKDKGQVETVDLRRFKSGETRKD